MQKAKYFHHVKICGKTVNVGPYVERLQEIFGSTEPDVRDSKYWGISNWEDGVGVPYIPTNINRIPLIVNQLDIRSKSKFVEIGSGDSRLLAFIAMIDDGSVGLVGYEIRQCMIEYSMNLLRKTGVSNRIKLIRADAKDDALAEIENADHIFLYMYRDEDVDKSYAIGKNIRTKLKPGTIVVSQSYAISNWEDLLLSHRDDLYEYRI